MTREEFQESIRLAICPFCKGKLKYYEGSLGYESLNCKPCKLVIDHTGIHLED